MDLLLLFDHRFYRERNALRSLTHYNYSLFESRYLRVFERVFILGRVIDAGGGLYEMGPNVFVDSLGNWRGGRLLTAPVLIRRKVAEYVRRGAAVIAIAPGLVGNMATPALVRAGHPYGVEVVGDPFDSLAPGAVRHPLRPLARRVAAKALKRQCRAACAVAYVTEKTLQQRYPPAPGAFSTSYSSIELDDAAFVSHPRRAAERPSTFRVITVGTMAQPYKAQEVLIDAVSICRRQGLDVRLIVVGDGQRRALLEERAAAAALKPSVEFVGQIEPGEAVRRHLRRADLFVLPSLTEGLPRAMLEAMAQGLPCLGSNIGGIPELLDFEELFPAGDAKSLARKILQLLPDVERRNELSARNWNAARRYHSSILRARRTAFYEYVRDCTRHPCRMPASA